MNRGRHLKCSWSLKSSPMSGPPGLARQFNPDATNFRIDRTNQEIIKCGATSTTRSNMMFDANLVPSARSHDQRSMPRAVHQSIDQECNVPSLPAFNQSLQPPMHTLLQHPCRSLGCLSKVVLIGRLRMADWNVIRVSPGDLAFH